MNYRPPRNLRPTIHTSPVKLAFFLSRLTISLLEIPYDYLTFRLFSFLLSFPKSKKLTPQKSERLYMKDQRVDCLMVLQSGLLQATFFEALLKMFSFFSFFNENWLKLHCTVFTKWKTYILIKFLSAVQSQILLLHFNDNWSQGSLIEYTKNHQWLNYETLKTYYKHKSIKFSQKVTNWLFWLTSHKIRIFLLYKNFDGNYSRNSHRTCATILRDRRNPKFLKYLLRYRRIRK